MAATDRPEIDPALDETTREAVMPTARARLERLPALTIVHHRDLDRVGEVARLTGLVAGQTVALSRKEPAFAAPGSRSARPLADPHVSRKPLRIRPAGRGRWEIEKDAGGTRLRVDGQPLLEGALPLDPARLERGVALELGGSSILLLHLVGSPRQRSRDHGLVGHSEGIECVRDAVERVAPLDVPVLLRGESGTGKELVARAIHAASRRSARPFVPINMAAIPSSTAASELFGHVRGAFTGAVRDHAGFFGLAAGGTLFLDEIADTPADVQAMLLRVLETGEIQRIGGPRPERVDVRLVAATDADLEAAIDAERFRLPLLHRLAGYQIELPPLRDRLDDLARLLARFLREELRAAGSETRLRTDPDARPWLPAAVTTRLLAHDWPGNVRELRNVSRHLVVSSQGQDEARLDDVLARRLAAPVEAPLEPVRAAELDEDAVIEALRRHAWRPARVARELGVSRTTLYRLINESSRIRKAADLTPEEIQAASERCDGDLDRMVEVLEVSKRGIQLRMRDLGM